MTDKPDGKRWRRIKWALIAPAVIIAYVLSVGPAAWLVKATGQRWLFVFYAPLWLLAGISEPIRLALNRYIAPWMLP